MNRLVSRVAGQRSSTSGGEHAERLLAYGMCAFLAMRFTFSGMHLGTLVAAALLPVTLRCIRRYRGATLILVLSMAAAASGMMLTWASAVDHRISTGNMLANTVMLLGIGISTVALLWARSLIGMNNVAIAYGVGSLISVVLRGLHPENPWKFSLAIPVILIVMSLPALTKSPYRQAIAFMVVAGFSAITDARSLSVTLLIAAALLLTNRNPGAKRKTSGWVVSTQIALTATGAYLAAEAAILEGMLGDNIRMRTEQQIAVSGNLLAGGRPEMGATFALLKYNPFGFGTGTFPSYQDIFVAKTGMKQLGYNPNNGYVHRYMFGSSFEVHSVIGDLWLLGGILGMLLAVTVTVMIVAGMAQSIAAGRAFGVALFLGGLSIWNLLFSPLPTSFYALTICLALLLPEQTSDDAHLRRGGLEARPVSSR